MSKHTYNVRTKYTGKSVKVIKNPSNKGQSSVLTAKNFHGNTGGGVKKARTGKY